MKKICIVSPGFYPIPAVRGGGVEGLVTILIEQNEIYHFADMTVFTVQDERLEDIQYQYCNITEIEKQSFLAAIIIRIINRIARISGIQRQYGINDWKIAKAVNEFNGDVVVVENNMHIFHLICKKSFHGRILFHLHNSIKNDPGKNYKWTKEILENTDCVMAVSNYIKNQLQEVNSQQDIRTLYNCVDQETFTSIDKEEKNRIRGKYGISESEWVVLYCGRLSEEKGAEEAIKALSVSCQKMRPFTLLLAGASWFHSNVENRYMKKIKELSKDVGEHIVSLGYVPNEKMPEIYGIADITIVPSKIDEAFGLTALESILCRVPVIASKEGGLPEVINNDVGWLIDMDDKFHIHAEKIIHEAKTNREQYSRKKQLTREYAISKFPSVKKYYEDFCHCCGIM